jgi:hypothetical protein
MFPTFSAFAVQVPRKYPLLQHIYTDTVNRAAVENPDSGECRYIEDADSERIRIIFRRCAQSP